MSGNTGSLFAINPLTGALSFSASPDYETGNNYNIVVRATDNGAGTLFDETTISVNISNLNESPFFLQNFNQPLFQSRILNFQSDNELAPDNLLGLSLSGGDRAQSELFYAQDSFRQIIQEDVVYMLDDLKDGVTDSTAFRQNISTDDIAFGIVEQLSVLNASERQFTNLRDALEFLQNVENQNIKYDPEQRSSSDLPDIRKVISAETSHKEDIQDLRFVDSMTYHEERLTRLRQALMG